MGVVAKGERGDIVPLLLCAYSHEEHGCHSENETILSAVSHVRQRAGDRLWMIDCGGDRGRLWEYWLKHDCSTRWEAGTYGAGMHTPHLWS